MAKGATALTRPSLKLATIPQGNVKAATSAAGAKGRQMFEVPIENIKVFKGFNIRIVDTPDYEEDIQRLQTSITREGFLNTKALSCFASIDAEGEDVIYVIDGHRRLEAAKRAKAAGVEGLDMLPVILKPVDTDVVSLAVSLDVENTSRQLQPMEKAVLANRLRKSGMSVDAIAERMGITPRYVNDLDVLINAPKEVRDLVSNGKVAAHLAVKKLRKGNDEAVADLSAMAERAAESGRNKATQQDDGPGRPKVKMTRETIKYTGVEGTSVPWEELERFVPFFQDEDWYKWGRSTKKVTLTEPVEITVTVRRVAKDPVEEEIVEEPVEATPAPRKRGRRQVQQEEAGEEAPVTVADVVTGGDASDPDDVPDLEAAGIADRVEDEDNGGL